MAKEYKTQLHCAWIVGEITASEIEALAAAGFEGVESRATQNVDVKSAREARRICEANGIKIHSVMCSGNLTNDAVADAEIAKLERGLAVAAEYGASSMLVVPGRIEPSPISPKETKIEFDPETLELLSIGVDTPEASKYVAAQNAATRAVRRRLPKVFKTAAYEGIRIGIENVWNNLWISPEFYASFVHSFDSPWVGSYFDLGNHAKYSPTQNWLRALGKGTIVKMHFKDFLYEPETPSLGRFVPVGEGSNDWLAIRDVLEEIEYNGFLTIEFEEGESRKLTAEQHVRKFRNFFAGVPILDGV